MGNSSRAMGRAGHPLATDDFGHATPKQHIHPIEKKTQTRLHHGGHSGDCASFARHPAPSLRPPPPALDHGQNPALAATRARSGLTHLRTQALQFTRCLAINAIPAETLFFCIATANYAAALIPAVRPQHTTSPRQVARCNARGVAWVPAR